MVSKVLVPLAQGCEELEAVTIIDLLRRAGIEVITASLDDAPITASRGVKLIADTHLSSVVNTEFDMIVLPGGLPGADHLKNDPRIIDMLKNLAARGKYTAAICAAPKVLAHAGMLNNKSATAYPGVFDQLQIAGLDNTGEAVVVDGKVITSRGPGTAMDFALTLIEQLAGQEKRIEVENGLVR